MEQNKFASVAATPDHPRFDELTSRKNPLTVREGDIRSEFARDYTRVLHSRGYRRLKQKTQVFFNIDNDHICTRAEHVLHVESVSGTIAKTLGLNTELTQAISTAHDIGHAPFAHQGERILNALSEQYAGRSFWHEQNGLRFVDDIELLEDSTHVYRPLDLTYAVRDGIISHCGEVDENGLHPRKDFVDLSFFDKPGKFSPATWEACVVKMADKIAYVGRDIEDATKLGFLTDDDKRELAAICDPEHPEALNTSGITYRMITDICRTSTPETGICLSPAARRQLDAIKQFNYRAIYRNPRLDTFNEYARLVLTQLFTVLFGAYSGANTISTLIRMADVYHELAGSFAGWLMKYTSIGLLPGYANRKIYGALETEEVYARAIIDYLSGMTDHYALKVFNELITY